MPMWRPKPIWTGQDAFIIGGGPSLRDFNWNVLVLENTIGCNNAFRLGADVCKVVLFVDHKLIFDGKKRRKGFYDLLAKFPNPVVTNDMHLQNNLEPWLKVIRRKTRGLHTDALGYNRSCGASAVNLAILLGAKTIYLLGFDMARDSKGRPNWHDHVIEKTSDDVYARMVAAFGDVRRDLRKFAGVEVFNLNPASKLKVFPKLDPDDFWAERARRHRHEYCMAGG